MVEFSPQWAMELRLGGRRDGCGSSSRPDGDGCVLTLINRFDEIGKAARDAAGWHACLDALEASLDGVADRRGRPLGRGPPGLRRALRPRGRDARAAELSELLATVEFHNPWVVELRHSRG